MGIIRVLLLCTGQTLAGGACVFSVCDFMGTAPLCPQANVGLIQEPRGPDLPSHPPNQHLRSAALAMRPPRLAGWGGGGVGVSCCSAGLAAFIGTI